MDWNWCLPTFGPPTCGLTNVSVLHCWTWYVKLIDKEWESLSWSSRRFSTPDIWGKNEGRIWEAHQSLWRSGRSWRNSDSYFLYEGRRLCRQAAPWVDFDFIFTSTFDINWDTILASSSWKASPPSWRRCKSPTEPAGSCPPGLHGWGRSSTPSPSLPSPFTTSWIWEAPSDGYGKAEHPLLLHPQCGRLFLTSPTTTTNNTTTTTNTTITTITTSLLTATSTVLRQLWISLRGLWKMWLSLRRPPWLLLHRRQVLPRRVYLWSMQPWALRTRTIISNVIIVIISS